MTMNKTNIAMVLDRSGSMSTCQQETNTGLKWGGPPDESPSCSIAARLHAGDAGLRALLVLVRRDSAHANRPGDFAVDHNG
jgi:hypothetical protein